MSGAAAGVITTDAAEAERAFGSGGALFGLDLGAKTIGVAASDPLRLTASALTTIRRTRFSADADTLEAMIAERSAVGLVLGLPMNMDGSEGPRAQSTRAFARNLSQRGAPPILLWDERWSTVAVERVMIDGDLSRKKRSEVVDQAAATYILQGALDRLRTAKTDFDPFWDADRPGRTVRSTEDDDR